MIFNLNVLAPVSARHVFSAIVTIVPSVAFRSSPQASDRPFSTFFVLLVHLLHLVYKVLLYRSLDLSLIKFFIKTGSLPFRYLSFFLSLLISFITHFLNYTYENWRALSLKHIISVILDRRGFPQC